MSYNGKYIVKSKWRFKENYLYGQVYALNDIEKYKEDNTIYRKDGKNHGFIYSNSFTDVNGNEIIDWTIPEGTVMEIIAIYPKDGHIANINGIYLQFCDIDDLDNILEIVEE